MTDPQAQKILDLIEAVDPEDTEKLDEIDRLVREYVNLLDEWPPEFPEYTRSRNALKAIRPEGYWPIKLFKDGHVFRFELTNGRKIPSSAWLPTEELAELHAIIQAIAHEMGQK
ncbi:MAG: hypothetical protein M3O22_04975 [Pseudomonadota bacterium]|nr:hypothetical protein [Pseudomonadota bacterium]